MRRIAALAEDARETFALREALERWALATSNGQRAVATGNTRARVVDLSLNQAGLQVTVSRVLRKMGVKNVL